MTVEIQPETGRLLQEEIDRGQVHSVDELILVAVEALRERRAAEPRTPPGRKSLYDLLTHPPFAGSELNVERQKEYPRPIDL